LQEIEKGQFDFELRLHGLEYLAPLRHRDTILLSEAKRTPLL
jgi:hypothetical protein